MCDECVKTATSFETLAARASHWRRWLLRSTWCNTFMKPAGIELGVAAIPAEADTSVSAEAVEVGSVVTPRLVDIAEKFAGSDATDPHASADTGARRSTFEIHESMPATSHYASLAGSCVLFFATAVVGASLFHNPEFFQDVKLGAARLDEGNSLVAHLGVRPLRNPWVDEALSSRGIVSPPPPPALGCIGRDEQVDAFARFDAFAKGEVEEGVALAEVESKLPDSPAEHSSPQTRTRAGECCGRNEFALGLCWLNVLHVHASDHHWLR